MGIRIDAVRIEIDLYNDGAGGSRTIRPPLPAEHPLVVLIMEWEQHRLESAAWFAMSSAKDKAQAAEWLAADARDRAQVTDKGA